MCGLCGRLRGSFIGSWLTSMKHGLDGLESIHQFKYCSKKYDSSNNLQAAMLVY